MTWLSDTTQLVNPNWLSSAYRGHGIRGADVPTDGTNGGSPVVNDLDFPTDSDTELRWDIVLSPIDGTLQVFEDLTYIWTPPPGTVNAARTIRYTLKGYSDSLYTDNEVILLGVGDYTQVSGDLALAWSNLGSAQQDAALSWTLRGAVQSDRSLAWSVESVGQAISDQAIAWFTRSAVQTDSVLSWTLRSAVQTDSVLSWTLRSAVQANSTLTWQVLNAGQVISDQAVAWLTYQSILANRDLAWAVGAVLAVVSDAGLTWATRVTVERDRTLSWAVSTTAVPPVVRLKVTFTKMPTFITTTTR